LAQIAQGKHVEAVARLDQLALTAAPADLGLAYALAGQTDRAVAMLEGAARAPGADGRIRQNLALAYALAGDWPKARLFAAQDVSPAELPGRLQQWAAFAKPQAPHTQIASLLGIAKVVEDAGQPTELALAPEAPEPVAVAEAPALEEQPIAATVELPASASVSAEQVLAEAVKIEAPAQADPAIAEAVAEASYAEAAETLVKPKPEVIRAAVPASAPLPAFKPAVERTSFAPPAPKKSNGRYVVQIGAFKTAVQIERAWVEAQKRYSFDDRQPLSTTVSIAGKGTFHRLSVSGFDNAAEANQLCSSIKAKGGACFVRTSAGDAPVQWASRQTRTGGR
jgi:cell division protein FtsN